MVFITSVEDEMYAISMTLDSKSTESFLLFYP